MDETSASYTRTDVGLDTQQFGRAPRRLFAATLLGASVLTAATGWALERYRQAAADSPLDRWPVAAEALLWIGRALQHPAGMALSVFAVTTLLLLALKGALDRFLKLLIGLNAVWLILFVVGAATSWALLARVARFLAGPEP
ncbi:MAG TPA: hypothetical protein VNO22_18585 [Planctomycetota bacterium]|nr:hypothetical protein [Planctomycetota bacterium]